MTKKLMILLLLVASGSMLAQAPKPLTIDQTYAFTGSNVADTFTPFKGTLQFAEQRAQSAIDKLNKTIPLQMEAIKIAEEYKANTKGAELPDSVKAQLASGLSKILGQCGELSSGMADYYEKSAKYHKVWELIYAEYKKRPEMPDQAAVDQAIIQAHSWIIGRDNKLAADDTDKKCQAVWAATGKLIPSVRKELIEKK